MRFLSCDVDKCGEPRRGAGVNAEACAVRAPRRALDAGEHRGTMARPTQSTDLHLATAFGLTPYRSLSASSEAFDRCIAIRMAFVVVALP